MKFLSEFKIKSFHFPATFTILVILLICSVINNVTAALLDSDGAAQTETNSLNFPEHLLARRLVHLTFDEGEGDVANDISGNKNTGTVHGKPDWPGAVIGSGINFDGKDDYVDVPLQLPRRGSISLWYHPDSLYNYNTVFDNSIHNNYWEMWIQGENIPKPWYTCPYCWRFRLGSDKKVSGDGRVDKDIREIGGKQTWHHAVVTWEESGRTTLYLNGEWQDEAVTADFADPGSHIYLGGNHRRNTRGKGIMDEFVVFDDVLSPQDVQALYQYVPAKEKTVRTISGDKRFIDKPEGFDIDIPMANSVPTVDYLIYPTGSDTGNRDHWGSGLVHSNGKVYTVIGNHGGINGNSYLYEYDPPTKRMRIVADLQEAVAGFVPSDWGFGKVHGWLDEGSDGNIYFSSWWGSICYNKNRQEEIDCSIYKGDRIFHYDPRTETIHDHGITLSMHGPPGTRLNAKDMLFYELSFDYFDKKKKRFLVYDLKSEQLIFNESASSGKELCVDNEGNAYFRAGGVSLQKYSPQSNSISNFVGTLPSKDLSRCTRPDANGIMYGSSGGTLFALDPITEEIRNITSFINGSIRALALDPTNRYIYYLAGTRSSGLLGIPVVQVDLHNNASQKVIAFLEDVLVNDLGYIPDVPNRATLTMSLLIDHDGRKLYTMLNGRQQGVEKGDECELRLMIASDNNPEEEMISNFKEEFESNVKACSVLIVRATSDSEKWTIAGFHETGRFNTFMLDDPKHELSEELKKEPINKRRIAELAASRLGRTPGSVAFVAVHIPEGEAVFPISSEIGVAIDIRPGNKRNKINRRSKGSIWVAVLSSSEFDPMEIEIPTVRFGPNGTEALRHRVKDVNKDGLSDLMLKFKIPQTGISCGDTEASLSGVTFSGQKITGTDAVNIGGCKK